MDFPKDYTVTYDERPWGFSAVLNDAGPYKIQELIILPHQLPYLPQDYSGYRYDRSWHVLEGTGLISRDGVEQILEAADTIWISDEAATELACNGSNPLVVLEVSHVKG